ncbi:MAG: NfeD family protein [Deltaproteobacteria bacterium]|nr:NfeD family protein [Deltaproteobacteria bacterium]MBW2448221.1 NfeD family protein [Deltaproteobacteria bacterium]
MGRTFQRYLLFQLPEWGLVVALLVAIHRYTEAPTWLLVAAAAGFVAKDLALYPWMKRAYEHVGSDPGEKLVGRQGVATSLVSEDGWVRVDAELWRAETRGDDIPKGAPVTVRALDGHVLVVDPAAEATG